MENETWRAQMCDSSSGAEPVFEQKRPDQAGVHSLAALGLQNLTLVDAQRLIIIPRGREPTGAHRRPSEVLRARPSLKRKLLDETPQIH